MEATSALCFVRPRPLFCNHAECVAENGEVAAASLWDCVKSSKERWRRAQSVSRLGPLKGSQRGYSLAHLKSANVSTRSSTVMRPKDQSSKRGLITYHETAHFFPFLSSFLNAFECSSWSICVRPQLQPTNRLNCSSGAK